MFPCWKPELKGVWCHELCDRRHQQHDGGTNDFFIRVMKGRGTRPPLWTASQGTGQTGPILHDQSCFNHSEICSYFWPPALRFHCSVINVFGLGVASPSNSQVIVALMSECLWFGERSESSSHSNIVSYINTGLMGRR